MTGPFKSVRAKFYTLSTEGPADRRKDHQMDRWSSRATEGLAEPTEGPAEPTDGPADGQMVVWGSIFQNSRTKSWSGIEG